MVKKNLGNDELAQIKKKMNNPRTRHVLLPPLVGLIALLTWSLMLPLMLTGGNLSHFTDALIYLHFLCTLFGIQAWIWIVAAYASFAFGLLLVVFNIRDTKLGATRVTGSILAILPAVIMCLMLAFGRGNGT